MQEDYPIIVIGRSFGAGGRAIGKLLSSYLSIPYYDNELLKAAAEEFGFSSSVFASVDEKRPSWLKRLLTLSYGVQENYNPEALSSETLYQAQSRVIRSIADKGPCIFVGRTADYILRDYPGVISIFLHAPLEYRAAKIMARGDASSKEEALELARLRDRERESYYNYFTGRKWGSAPNYTLSLDSSQSSPERLVDVILTYSGLKDSKKI